MESLQGPGHERIFRSLVIDGKRFEVVLLEEGSESWRWCITAPGELALSGEATSEIQALHRAGRAGRALAHAQMGVIRQRI